MVVAAALLRGLGIEADPNEFLLTAAKHRLDWLEQARPNQIAPPSPWQLWGVQAGRGFGKTRVGAEETFWYGVKIKDARLGIVAPTHGDVRDTCFEGESGLLSIIPSSLIARGGYVRTLAELTLRDGTRYKGFSATEPSRLRGPQHHWVWFDEFAAFEDNYLGCAEECYDMAMFGLRLGQDPQSCITTTPRPLDILKKLRRDPTSIWSGGSTYENRENLPKAFYDKIVQYEGTRLGEQEIHAKILDMEDIGIISRSWFRLWSAQRRPPRPMYIVISFDTAQTEKTIEKKDSKNKFRADPTAIQVWGLFNDDHGLSSLMLLDVWQDHLGFPELLAKAREYTNMRWFGRGADLLLIEDKGSGISLRQVLASEGVECYPYNPGRADKLLRLNLVSHIIKRGRVWLFESERAKGKPKSWYEPFLTQICSFIGEGSIRHDDHVDAGTQAIRFFMDQGLLPLAPPRVDSGDEALTGPAGVAVAGPARNPYSA
jgi:predicted phage terminase large subunit-like protein